MSNKTYENKLLREALVDKKITTAEILKDFLKAKADLEKAPSSLSLKNRIFNLMQRDGKYYEVSGLESLAKEPKKCAEYTQRGIFVRAALIEGCTFTQGNKQKKEEGAKFKVEFTKKDITLTLVEK